MSTLRAALRGLRGLSLAARPQGPVPTMISTLTPKTAPTSVSPAARRTFQSAATGSRGMDQEDEQEVRKIRPRPVSPSYFARFTTFYDSFVNIQDLYLKYSHLPTVPTAEAPRAAWLDRAEYRLMIGQHIKGRDFAACMKLVRRLHLIHPDMMPEDVVEGLKPFKRDINFHIKPERVIPVDKFGRTLGVGRRKTSTARAWVVEGTGEVLINGKPVIEAFARLHDRESALWALKSTERMDKYNVWARVEGGGTTGQAEALAMAIAHAITGHEPALKTRLRRAGCITRDFRAVERKKPGRVKARKMTPWQPR